jgi:hypothetical protein
METLQVLEVDYKTGALSRTEVEVLGRQTIAGVECFFHQDGPLFIVSHVESGGRVAENTSDAAAIWRAEANLSDKAYWRDIITRTRNRVLNQGFPYPINPVSV